MQKLTKKDVNGLTRIIGLTLAVSLGTGIVVFILALVLMIFLAAFIPPLFAHRYTGALIISCIGAVVMAAVMVSVCVRAGKDNVKEQKLLKEMGLCPEFIEKLKKVVNLKNEYTKFHIGEYYLSIYDYENAEKWLLSANVTNLDSDSATTCRINRIELYAATGRTRKAEEILEEYRGKFEAYADKSELNAMKYKTAIATVHTCNKNYDKALEILEQMEREYSSETLYGFLIKTCIVCVYSRMGEMGLMNEKKREAFEALEKVKSFPYEWSKNYYLDALEKASQGII